jgi:hypothetical protein
MTLAALGLDHAPPRRIREKAAGSHRTGAETGLGTLVFAALASLFLIGGAAVERAVAVAFGVEATGTLVSIGEQRSLKGRRTDVVEVRYRDGGGSEHTGVFPVESAMARSLGERMMPPEVRPEAVQALKDRVAPVLGAEHLSVRIEAAAPPAPQLAVRYLESAPGVAGLVDDGGRGAGMLWIWAGTMAFLVAVAMGGAYYDRRVRRPWLRHMWVHGQAVRLELGKRSWRSTCVTYDVAGEVVARRITNAELARCPTMDGAKYALVEARRPKRLLLVTKGGAPS